MRAVDPNAARHPLDFLCHRDYLTSYATAINTGTTLEAAPMRCAEDPAQRRIPMTCYPLAIKTRNTLEISKRVWVNLGIIHNCLISTCLTCRFQHVLCDDFDMYYV